MADDVALSIVDVHGSYDNDEDDVNYSDGFEEGSDDDDYVSDKEDNEDDERNMSQSPDIRVSSPKDANKNNKINKSDAQHTPPEILLKSAEKDIKNLVSKKKNDLALKELVRCVALTRIIYGDKHWKHAQAFSNLAKGYFDLKGYAPQARQHAETAKSIMMSGLHTSQSDEDKAAILTTFLDVYYTSGRSCSILKKYNEAEQWFLKADSVTKETAKLSTISQSECRKWDVKIAIALAKVSSRQQKHARAMTYYEHSKDLITNGKDHDNLDLIPIYQGMGQVEQSKGKHANQEYAIEMYLQAHSIASAHYKSNSVELADTAKALAAAYSNTGDPHGEASAESYLNECLATYQLAYGPNNCKTIGIQDELARLMIRTDRKQDAIALTKSTIPAKEEVYGEFSDEVADTYKLIGSVHLANGNMELALKAFRKCHSVLNMMYGSNHKRVKEIQGNIDVLLANPNLAAKEKLSNKNKALSERPRFNSIVNRSSNVGGFKS